MGPILAELAEGQDWSNFKSEVAGYQGKIGASYSWAALIHRTDIYSLGS
jgi:hypothetical protein